MSEETISYVASGDVPVMRFVKQGGEQFRCSLAGSGDTPIGVAFQGSYYAPGVLGTTAALQELAAPDGKPLRVYGDGEVGMLIAGEQVSGGQLLKPDANGFGVGVNTSLTSAIQRYGFRCIESAASGVPVRGRVELGFFPKT